MIIISFYTISTMINMISLQQVHSRMLVFECFIHLISCWNESWVIASKSWKSRKEFFKKCWTTKKKRESQEYLLEYQKITKNERDCRIYSKIIPKNPRIIFQNLKETMLIWIKISSSTAKYIFVKYPMLFQLCKMLWNIGYRRDHVKAVKGHHSN